MKTVKIIITTFLSIFFFYSCELVEKYELPEEGSIVDATPPQAAFVFTQDNINWETFSFENKSKGALFYKWDFGEGTVIESSDKETITHQFPKLMANYEVKLTATDNLEVSHDTIINVDVTPPQPEAVFSVSIQKRSRWNVVSFDSSNSISPDTYLWDFGDGNSSTEANPIHIYSNDGQFNVSLTVTTQFGATNTLTEAIVLNEPAHFIPEIIEPGFNMGNGGSNDTGDSRAFWRTSMRKTSSNSVIGITGNSFEGVHAASLTTDNKRIGYQLIEDVTEDVVDRNGNVVTPVISNNKFEKNVTYILKFNYRFRSEGDLRVAMVKPTSDFTDIPANIMGETIISNSGEEGWFPAQFEFNTGDNESLAIFFDNEGGLIYVDNFEFTLKD